MYRKVLAKHRQRCAGLVNRGGECMSHSELSGKERMVAAAMRGSITRGKQCQARYKANPKFCRYCNKKIDYSKRRNNFCNHSCAASINNFGKTHNQRKSRSKCRQCNYECNTPVAIYCSSNCQRKYEWNQTKTKALGSGRFESAGNAKRYLLEIHGIKCSICGLSEWNKKPMPVTIDHINGHYDDHQVHNVRLICPNCDALTPTYKGRNRGNGRHVRRKRYNDGKSY